ncbi:MAG: MFS transporter [Anaerolineales bacterium]|nr:MFS transporter [Anaerolineales bacterium]
MATFGVFLVLASLDNAAAGVLPPLFAIVARDLRGDEAALGTITAVFILVAAASAAFWGYRGDRGGRKRLLFAGTLVWVAAMALSGGAASIRQLLLWQLITAAGVGSISSIGFSIVSDVIPFHRRGLALSLWSISQTLGAAFGALLASTVGALNWRWPFFIIAALGALFALLYLFTGEPRRGQAEPDLAPLFAAGQAYTPRIRLADLPHILARRSNVWLLAHRFFFALAYGATVWIPRWAIARVEAEGYSLETATVVGNLFVTLFGLGLFFAVPAGHLGDRWQQRRPDGRARLAAFGLLASIPFFTALYFIPLRGLTFPEDAGIWLLAWHVIRSFFTNGWAALALGVAIVALALYACAPPNWAAMSTDVNLPEQRGTFIGISRIVRAVADAASVWLVGLLFAALEGAAPAPLNYAVGLALFQLPVIPAGIALLLAGRHVPRDQAAVRQQMRAHAQSSLSP